MCACWRLIEGAQAWVEINNEEMKQRRHLTNEYVLLNDLWVTDPPSVQWVRLPHRRPGQLQPVLIWQSIPTPVH